MKKRTLIIIVLIVACVAVLIAWVIKRELGQRPGITVVSAGPLDIRLWGVRPDIGGVIYDANGNKLQDTFGIARWDSDRWYNTSRRCDFIFELSEPNQPVLFGPYQDAFVSGEDVRLGRTFSYKFYAYKGRTLLWLRAPLSRTFRKPVLFGLWTRNIPFDALDLTLRYYHGPPREPVCSFKGPFTVGQKLTDQTGRYEITFKSHPDSGDFGHVLMELNTKELLDAEIPILAYDGCGTRRLLRADHSTSRSARGACVKYKIYDLYRIATLTLGEKHYERTFNNIRLDLPTQKPRTCAEYMEKMAKRLDLRLTESKLATYNFHDANEAFKVIDIVRGDHITLVCRAICADRFDGDSLNMDGFTSEQIQKLRHAALRWSQAMDPEIRAAGVAMGLWCAWPEFVEPTLQLLEYKCVYNLGGPSVQLQTVAATLSAYTENLSDREIDRIRHILVHLDYFGAIMHLRSCLRRPKSQARVKALWELAHDDRPWLWWFAMGKLSEWKEFDDKEDLLPKKLKLRLHIIRGPRGFSNPEQFASEAYELQKQLLTPQLYALDYGAFYRVLARIAKHPDREYATSGVIGFLRLLRAYSRNETRVIERIIKYINLWHGLNIGELGNDLEDRVRHAGKYNWPAITAEAIEWYDTKYKAVDPNSAR